MYNIHIDSFFLFGIMVKLNIEHHSLQVFISMFSLDKVVIYSGTNPSMVGMCGIF